MHNRFDYRLIRQLLIFAVVCEEEGIRGAARRLLISQSPLSAQLDELEHRLGMRLLERTRRGTRPTAEGLALLPEVKRLIEQAEALEFSAKELKAGRWGLLSIGAVHEAMLFWVPQLREALMREMPGVSIFAKEIDSSDVNRELDENPSALMIGYQIEQSDSASRRSLLLAREKPVVVVARSHRLSERKTVALSELADEDWVFPGRDVSVNYVDRLVQTCRSRGFAPRIRHSVSSTMRQIAYASCGQGIALVPEFFARLLPETVSALTLSDVDPYIDIVLVWDPRCSSPVRDKLIALAEALAAAATG